jgi:hypothetical protein
VINTAQCLQHVAAFFWKVLGHFYELSSSVCEAIRQ